MKRVIALCGIDGTGKSTQADLLASRLGAEGIEVDQIWARWNPLIAKPAIRVLDRVSRAGASGPSGDGVASDNRRRQLKKRLSRSSYLRHIWTALMTVDYGLQIGFRVQRARRGTGVLIMDRYRHDVMVDLAVSLGPRPTPAVLRHLLPDPDLLIILDIDEEIAWQRKPDSPSLAYLTERRRAYQRLAEAANVQPIDASQSPSDVGNEIFERVLQLVPIDR